MFVVVFLFVFIMFFFFLITDMVNIKVLNAGAWSRSSDRIPVSLPTEVSFSYVVQLSQYVPALMITLGCWAGLLSDHHSSVLY